MAEKPLDNTPRGRLRALYDWTREGVAFPALRRWILSGQDAAAESLFTNSIWADCAHSSNDDAG